MKDESTNCRGNGAEGNRPDGKVQTLSDWHALLVGAEPLLLYCLAWLIAVICRPRRPKSRHRPVPGVPHAWPWSWYEALILWYATRDFGAALEMKLAIHFAMPKCRHHRRGVDALFRIIARATYPVDADGLKVL